MKLKTSISRRSVLAGAGAVAGLIGNGCSSAQPLTAPDFSPFWPVSGQTVLRGATLVQRIRDSRIDGIGGDNQHRFLIPHYDSADFEALAGQGANLVNLSLPGLWQTQAPYAADSQMTETLLQTLEKCRAAGLYATIGFRTGPGRSEFVFHRASADTWFPASLIVDEVWRRSEAQAAWGEMCALAAGLLAGRAEVAGFTPMVEPEPEMADMDASVWTGMCWQMAPAIRAAAPDLPLLISPPGFANPSRLGAMGTPNVEGVIWNVHDYGPFDYTHQAQNGKSMALPYEDGSAFAGRLKNAEQTGGGLPLYMGEFGAVRWAPDRQAYWQNRISALEAAGINWAAFRWPSSEAVYEDGDDNFTLHMQDTPDAVVAGWERSRFSLRPASGPAPRQALRPRQ